MISHELSKASAATQARAESLAPLFRLLSAGSGAGDRLLAYAEAAQGIDSADLAAAVSKLVSTWERPGFPPFAILRRMAEESRLERKSRESGGGPADSEIRSLVMCRLQALGKPIEESWIATHWRQFQGDLDWPSYPGDLLPERERPHRLTPAELLPIRQWSQLRKLGVHWDFSRQRWSEPNEKCSVHDSRWSSGAGPGSVSTACVYERYFGQEAPPELEVRAIQPFTRPRTRERIAGMTRLGDEITDAMEDLF